MQQRQAIKAVVQAAREEGFPTDVEDKESYFMSQVGRGEALCQNGIFDISSPYSCITNLHFLRFGPNWGSIMFLQSPQGLPSTPRANKYLRQNCAQASHRYTCWDDSRRPDYWCWSLRFWSELGLRLCSRHRQLSLAPGSGNMCQLHGAHPISSLFRRLPSSQALSIAFCTFIIHTKASDLMGSIFLQSTNK